MLDQPDEIDPDFSRRWRLAGDDRAGTGAIGPGTGLTKTKRQDRQSLASVIGDIEKHNDVRLSDAAKSWVDWGFLAEDDFDAMVGLLSMLLVVTGNKDYEIPDDDKVRTIEGWILGQPA